MIPVIDIFAGPGGLGEGLSSYRSGAGEQRFTLRLSIEKEEWAHATLRMRAFTRGLGRPPVNFWEILQSRGADWASVREFDLRAAQEAEQEAIRMELGPSAVSQVRELISGRLPRTSPWVLVGGPPCQAYSLVGRSRNRGNPAYVPEADARQTLYLEYLQILGDHSPPVFVMENVKGLLSAKLNGEGMFDRICADLRAPGKALRDSGRPSRDNPRYELHPLVTAEGGFPADQDSLPGFGGWRPSDFVVRAEQFGIPQARHRVILLGIRSDYSRQFAPLLPAQRTCTVKQALSGLPRLRSGVSRQADSQEVWMTELQSARKHRWFGEAPTAVRRRIRDVLDSLTGPRLGRGADFLRHGGRLVLNHSSRSHMSMDLHRYLFASAFAAETGVSPSLPDFPPALRPKHRNIARAMDGGHFADRFRVQMENRPSTTVTSHISKDGHYYIHYDPSQCRSLTVREAAELQTFPPDYFFCGPRTAQYQQVGNAVPPRLAQQIAGIVSAILS